jgi:hypothetical protein
MLCAITLISFRICFHFVNKRQWLGQQIIAYYGGHCILLTLSNFVGKQKGNFTRNLPSTIYCWLCRLENQFTRRTSCFWTAENRIECLHHRRQEMGQEGEQIHHFALAKPTQVSQAFKHSHCKQISRNFSRKGPPPPSDVPIGEQLKGEEGT